MSTTTVEAPVHPPQEELPIPKELEGAWAVLKRGLKESPELRSGLAFTVVVSIAATIAALLAPILIQQIFDHGFTANGFRAGFVFSICGAAFVLVILTYLAGRAAARRLATSSEAALKALRVKGFEHIHRLSIAAQTQERRGIYVARVTADVDTLSEFTEWGGIAWIVSFIQILGAGALMLVYSWQLTIPIFLLVVPMIWIVAKLQASLSEAFDLVRSRVGQMLSEVSESVMGAAVV
ncbi:MAG TPA: ABC transporter transmembrane domain-containing protein, partial [Actinomycetota bacterium]